MQQSCFFDRKRRKVRNMTAESVILLPEEIKNEWKDVILLPEEIKNEWKDDAGHDSGAHCPGDAEYPKLRKLAPRKRKKAGNEEASGCEGLVPRLQKKAASNEDA